MTKTKTPFFGLQAHGTISKSLTMRRSRKHTIAETIPSHRDANSALQQVHRTRFQQANDWWMALTLDQKLAFRYLKYPPNLTGHQRGIRQWMIDNPYVPPPPTFGFSDPFDDNHLELKYWQKVITGAATVLEQANHLECTAPLPVTLGGLCTRYSYDCLPATATVWTNCAAADYCKLTISLTKQLTADPAGDPDWYRLYLHRLGGRLWIDRRVGGAYANLFTKLWVAQANTLKITLTGPTIDFYEGAALVFSEPFALPSHQLYTYIDAQSAEGLGGMNWFTDFSLQR